MDSLAFNFSLNNILIITLIADNHKIGLIVEVDWPVYIIIVKKAVILQNWAIGLTKGIMVAIQILFNLTKGLIKSAFFFFDRLTKIIFCAKVKSINLRMSFFSSAYIL